MSSQVVGYRISYESQIVPTAPKPEEWEEPDHKREPIVVKEYRKSVNKAEMYDLEKLFRRGEKNIPIVRPKVQHKPHILQNAMEEMGLKPSPKKRPLSRPKSKGRAPDSYSVKKELQKKNNPKPNFPDERYDERAKRDLLVIDEVLGNGRSGRTIDDIIRNNPGLGSYIDKIIWP
eukprot:TRINITY_DN5789_c0_g1_i4.p1 TRINITY_DN5789_c0_g1~~TRINITY_DN5789_c0_g1_i4.p1  ORF type:complete len:175 (-),score=43.01 TRINITY_DN5789_c0_g1_i4:95-619(-)